VLDPGGWERVKEQFTKLVACLTDDGFAVLRLPHPFIHEFREDGTSVAAPEAARPAPARKKGKGKERFDWRRELEDRKTKKAQAPREDELRLEGDLDEFEDQALLDEVEVAPAHTGPATRKVWPSIAIDGAVGPETHVYRGTAVHLYMRKRSE
jgi:hypothetical protein